MLAAVFVVVPIALYVPLFLYETYCAFGRLKKSKNGRSNYLDATWEVTHTFLIIGVVNAIWLYSAAMTDVAKAVYWGLIVAGACFIVRAILYIYLFYVKDYKKQLRHPLFDRLFAVSHLGILAGLVYTILHASHVLLTQSFPVNTQFFPYMWLGLFLLVLLGAVPLAQLYRTK